MALQMERGEKNEILRTVSKPVRTITAEHRRFAADMIKKMDEENGVGIAAPQVGRNIRMVICKFNPGESNEVVLPMVNPILLQKSEKTTNGEEGCLSLPGTWGKVRRAKHVLVRFKNLKGKDQTLELTDFNARIVQHEIDHIDGMLFIDRAEEVWEKSAAKESKESAEEPAKI